MNKDIQKEIIYDLAKALEILQSREARDIPQLKELSEHAIEDIAARKDLELVSVTVLLYSLYKTVGNMAEEDYRDLLKSLTDARDNLQQNNLGRYNGSIRTAYEIIRRCNAKVREHLQDVMHAARIKKGSSLLQRGLSIGQAAGLMGLSNWDLQPYAGKTTVFEAHHEAVPASRRLAQALKLFGMN